MISALIILGIAAVKSQLDVDTINTLLKQRLPLVNDYIKTGPLFKGTTNLFDKIDNSLDPMDFNGHVTYTTGEEDVCSDKHCIHPFGHEICTPSLCYRKRLTAHLNKLTGLSSIQINDITVGEFTTSEDMDIDCTISLALYMNNLKANADASVSAGVLGLNIPSSYRGYLTVKDPSISAKMIVKGKLEVDSVTGEMYAQMKNTTTVQGVVITYSGIDVGFDSLPSALNYLVSKAVSGIKGIVNAFMDVNGKINVAITNGMKDAILEHLEDINQKLKTAPLVDIPKRRRAYA